MSKYGGFENQPVSRKPLSIEQKLSSISTHGIEREYTAARRAKISSILTSWGRKRVYVQRLELLTVSKLYAKIWQFGKSSHISEMAARRAKKTSISNPWGRKTVQRVFVQLREQPLCFFLSFIPKLTCISYNLAANSVVYFIFFFIFFFQFFFAP